MDWRATYRKVNFSVPPLSGQRHCSANVIAGLTASFWVPMRPSCTMARKKKTNNRKGKEPLRTSAPRAERHRPQCLLPQSYRSHPDPPDCNDTESKVADPFQDTQSPRHVPEKRGSCSIVPTWRSKRSTSLADATLDASLPSSKAPSAHRSMSPAGRTTYGGSRITPATHAKRRKSAGSHPQGPAAGSHQQSTPESAVTRTAPASAPGGQ